MQLVNGVTLCMYGNVFFSKASRRLVCLNNNKTNPITNIPSINPTCQVIFNVMYVFFFIFYFGHSLDRWRNMHKHNVTRESWWFTYIAWYLLVSEHAKFQTCAGLILASVAHYCFPPVLQFQSAYRAVCLRFKTNND